MGNTERTINRIAERQHSLVTRDQLDRAGLTEREVDYRVAERRLRSLYPGVYGIGGVRPYFEQNVLAACLATGGAASHRSAAALFQLRGFRPGPVEITVDGPRAPRLAGVTAHRAKDLPRTTIGVIPVTMPAQTLLDVAAVRPHLAEGAVADALVRRLVGLPGLVAFLADRSRSGRPGCRHLRTLVEAHVRGAQPTESWLEDRLLEAMRGWGLPEPERQYPLLLPGRRRPIRFDFAYPWCRTAVEADGRLWHSSPAERRRDEQRDEAAGRLGWTIERVTWLQLMEDPAGVAARIARSLTTPAAA